MKLIKFFFVVFFMVQSVCFADNIPVEENSGLFSVNNSATGEFTVHLNLNLLTSIVIAQPEQLTINLPLSNNKSIRLNLFKANIFSEDFKVTSSSGKEVDKQVLGVPYWGIVEDNKVASFLFFHDEVLGSYSEKNSVYELQKIGINNYKVNNYNASEGQMHCLTDDLELDSNTDNSLEIDTFIQDKPISVYIEVNYEFPELYGARINKVALVMFNFLQSALLFRNEEIILNVSEIFVWDTKSPYGGSEKKQDKKNPSMPQFLTSFKKHRKTFNADLALLFVEFSSFGNGIASKVGGLCSDRLTDKMGVVKTYWDYATEYPKHSRGYKMVAHELGHLLGSPHTYNCSWNGNKTSLDNCRGRGKNCKDSRIDYDNRKDSDFTIMSYCETKSDILKGLGVQPGNKIRNFIANASCLSTINTWEETLVLHHQLESDYYETYNAKYKANTIHAFNEIKSNANAFIVAKDAIYLKEGFIAEEGSYTELKITDDNVVVIPDKNVYETNVRTYSVNNVINNIIEDDTIQSITIIDILGNEVKTIQINSEQDYLDVPIFFNGFYMVKTTYKDGSIKIRKK